MSVRPSVRHTPVLCLNGYTYPQSFFSPPGSPTILVFPHQTEWKYSGGDGAFLTDDGRLFHARAEATEKERSPSVERLCQQSADDVKCRRQMSGEGSQQGTTALFHEDKVRPERKNSGAHEAMGLCVLTASLRKPNGRRLCTCFGYNI